jgi:hypothetical protein
MNEALLDALNGFRALVAAYQSTSRVQWTDNAIAMLGRAEKIDPPERWNIYEPTLIRDAITKMIQAMELYNTAADQSQQAAAA